MLHRVLSGLIWLLCYYTYSRLSLSRNRRDPKKQFEISVLRHIRFVVLRTKQFEQPIFTNDYVIWLLWIEMYIENIVEKGRNCSPGAISPLFHNILSPDFRFLCLTRTRFFLRDKRLFEITEVEKTRVDCILMLTDINNRHWEILFHLLITNRVHVIMLCP